MDLSIYNWNLRGLNNLARRKAILDVFALANCNIACFEETKLAVVSRSVVVETLGPKFADNFIFKPADGTRGGILIAVSTDFAIESFPGVPGRLSLSGRITDRSDGSFWDISCVYGPQDDSEKIEFLQELRLLRPLMHDKWLLLGDFNLISQASDKSNANLNLRMMGRFRSVIEDLELREFQLVGRKFTWSSDCNNNVMTRIDRVYMTKEWEFSYPQYQLTPASSSISDHCPLLLKKMDVRHFKGFRFESYWVGQAGFKQVVSQAWNKQVHSNDAFHRLHTKLSRVSKALKKWHKKKRAECRLQAEIANDVFFGERLGSEVQRSLHPLWDSIGLPSRDLRHLENEFSLDELKSAVFEIHPEKAPGPDGFIGKFYRSCWDIIKDDLLKATCQFHSLRPGCWHLLN
ncbi:hypothetical protein ACQ4PT_065875 [Festuca glaucescens]